jgi:hypothetical protein
VARLAQDQVETLNGGEISQDSQNPEDDPHLVYHTTEADDGHPLGVGEKPYSRDHRLLAYQAPAVRATSAIAGERGLGVYEAALPTGYSERDARRLEWWV